MIIKLGTDSGKSQSRFALEDKGTLHLYKFPTVVEKESSRASNDGYEVEFEGVRYLVGDKARTNNNESTKTTKLTRDHKICIYTGIALAMKKLERSNNCHDEIHISVNVPITVFKDKDKRQEVIDYYVNNRVEIRIDGTLYRFTIVSVKPYYEGMGAWLNNMNRVGSSVIVYDFGSLNINFLHFENGRVVGENCHSLEIGGSELVSKINAITLKDDVKFTDNHIYRLSNNEEIRNISTEHLDVAKDVIREHVKQIEVETKNTAKRIPFGTADIIFSGGALDVYEEYLQDKDVFSNQSYYLSDENVFDNAIGSLRTL